MGESTAVLSQPKICGLGERCCGCGACAAICPKGCIEMLPDSAGFRRPTVDENACEACGMCERVCPALNKRDRDSSETAWWARSADDELLDESSSGGLFGLLARNVINHGGTVYGAAYDNGCKAVRHLRVDSFDGLGAVMRSKYVQSAIDSDAYQGVARDLKTGLHVLFSGTACQVSGMRGYLEARRVPMDRLLLVDVICHGVPSPRLWHDWIEYREKRAGGAIREANQRSKSSGWTTYSVAYKYATEKVESSAFGEDWYMKAFLNNASLRSSCLACPAKRSCGSDITLGDFWGVKERHPEAFDDRGVSAVIANTAKGFEAIEGFGDLLVKGPSTVEDIAFGNPSLVKPVVPYARREAFLDDVAAGTPVGELMRRWSFKPSLQKRAVGKLKRVVKKMIGRG